MTVCATGQVTFGILTNAITYARKISHTHVVFRKQFPPPPKLAEAKFKKSTLKTHKAADFLFINHHNVHVVIFQIQVFIKGKRKLFMFHASETDYEIRNLFYASHVSVRLTNVLFLTKSI